MKVYILTKSSDESAFIKTFKSLEDLLNEVEIINQEFYDGSSWSIFGRGQKQVMVGEEIDWVDADSYDVDSVVLVSKSKGKLSTYHKFLIRCINGTTGQIIDLE